MTQKVYSTIELINILEEERRACLQGKRLNLTKMTSGNPLIDKFIKTDGLQKFAAFQDFQATIHQYQRDYQVSGIIWQELTVNDQTIIYPSIYEHLISIPMDLQILQQSKKDILKFWDEVTKEMKLYLSVNNGKDTCEINQSDVERIANRTEWANLSKSESVNHLELSLQLGWGKPEEATYKRGLPESGSEFIVCRVH
ncbi:MAG TPA: hypothetical protein V6C58_24385 [Allocoleopsis sp.]